ncbi:hypothetical protein KW807_02175 [Candidatus Parcubacteria bacterium]|nr:hypothetical protein [Candidatus Parcubacteria bacterium]
MGQRGASMDIREFAIWKQYPGAEQSLEKLRRLKRRTYLWLGGIATGLTALCWGVSYKEPEVGFIAFAGGGVLTLLSAFYADKGGNQRDHVSRYLESVDQAVKDLAELAVPACWMLNTLSLEEIQKLSIRSLKKMASNLDELMTDWDEINLELFPKQLGDFFAGKKQEEVEKREGEIRGAIHLIKTFQLVDHEDAELQSIIDEFNN